MEHPYSTHLSKPVSQLFMCYLQETFLNKKVQGTEQYGCKLCHHIVKKKFVKGEREGLE